MSGPVDTGRLGTIKDSHRKPFRILALDGGGVRAIIQATLLRRLQVHFPSILDEVDMFAGSSAGSIVAAAFCNGLTPEQTYDMWMNTAPKIFVEGYMRKVTTIDSVIGSAYNASLLEQNLAATTGTKKLKDLDKKILITSFNLDPPGHGVQSDNKSEHRWEPAYLHNFPDSSFLELPLLEAVLRSAAAPTYFPIRNGFVDGGTFANNPALAAMSIAINNGIRLEDIVILSISTGNNPKCITQSTYQEGNWGLAQWGPHVIDLLLDSNTESINHSCKCLLREQYMRVDPILSKNIPLDDATQLNTLVAVADALDISSVVDWMNKYWKANEQQQQDPTQDFFNIQTPKPSPAPIHLQPSKGYCAMM